MKKILIILFAISSLWTSAQNYTLFNSASKKVFTEFPEADSTYSLAFDSVRAALSDSVYFPYYGVEADYIVSENCQFWGPPDCRQQIKPIWIGQKIIYGNENKYWFFNNQGDTLKFNFGIQTGETSLFYEDGNQRFHIFSEGADTLTVIGLVDSLKTYRILHTDLQGNSINSTLNNQAIMIGKDFGLVRFFQVDQFPEVLKPLVILGNSSPEAGMHKLTNAMIYDHQPGDEIQFNEIFYSQYSPPYDHYNRFKKYVYLERDDTQDSIIYLVTRTIFDMGETNETTTSLYLKYPRNGIVAELPYDNIYPDYLLHKRYLKIADYCGFPLWTYSIKPEYLMYCAEENCWGYMDVPGPPPHEEIRHVAGLGLYLDESYISYDPYSYNDTKRIVYFKKNGVECGNEVMVGIQQYPLSGKMEISPNPASDRLFIKTDMPEKKTVQVFAINGALLMENTIQSQSDVIDISRLKSGFYLVKIIGYEIIAVQKFIKN